MLQVLLNKLISDKVNRSLIEVISIVAAIEVRNSKKFQVIENFSKER